MSTTSVRAIKIEFTGDVAAQQTATSASNTQSPAMSYIPLLIPGANVISPSPLGSVAAKALTIIPATEGTTGTITLKGATGDTGIVLHTIEPTSIALNSTTGTVVLTCSTTIVGTRLIWT